MKNLLQIILNSAFNSLEWVLNSPPKPHAFTSLPLQSEFLSDAFIWDIIKDAYTPSFWETSQLVFASWLQGDFSTLINFKDVDPSPSDLPSPLEPPTGPTGPPNHPFPTGPTGPPNRPNPTDLPLPTETLVPPIDVPEKTYEELANYLSAEKDRIVAEKWAREEGWARTGERVANVNETTIKEPENSPYLAKFIQYAEAKKGEGISGIDQFVEKAHSDKVLESDNLKRDLPVRVNLTDKLINNIKKSD